MSGFIKFLSELRHGETVEELDQGLADVVAACREHHKRGSLTLTIDFEPEGRGSVSITATDTVKTKVPTTPIGTHLYVQPDGSLSRRDPRQPSLPFREVAITAGEEAGAREGTNG